MFAVGESLLFILRSGVCASMRIMTHPYILLGLLPFLYTYIGLFFLLGDVRCFLVKRSA